jgi:hypothetical protein
VSTLAHEGMTDHMAGPATTVGRTAAGALFGALARTLGTRPLHPEGWAFAATLVVDEPRLPSARLFATRERRRAVVRFSRGFGLPQPTPDLMSMAVKVPDAYGPGRDHDILLAAAGERPVLRHLFAWGGDHLTRSFSSIVLFRVGAQQVLFGAAPRSPAADDLRAAAAAGGLEFDIRVATPTGPWRTVARLEIGDELSEAEEEGLAFNSSRTGGGISPVGLVNRVRDAAYDAAARGRDAV